jgi:hypothetical protein
MMPYQQVRREVSLVFCLKELKALLVFVDFVSEVSCTIWVPFQVLAESYAMRAGA